VVSIHDVAPSTSREVAWLRSRLGDLGVERRVLKVIPNEAGERPVDEDAGLVEVLRAEQAAGGEVVLHGWTHLVADGQRRTLARFGAASPVDRMRARLFAWNTAEFLDLPDAEARRWIDAGRSRLEGIGLAVEGFCAPGWLAGPAVSRLLRAAGFRYLVGFARVIDLERRRWYLLPGFGAMGTDDVQDGLVAVEGGLVLLAAPVLPVIRAFLHPQGATASRACARTLRAIARLRPGRDVATFRELLGPGTAARAQADRRLS